MNSAPNPRTWTLRFKYNRTTVLLYVDPLQPLASVRAELLKAIQQTNPSGKFNGQNIPSDAGEILLAKPVDINDLSAGWEQLERRDKDADLFADEEMISGKGKAKAGSPWSAAKKEDKKLLDCPQGARLRDGGVVAFKFRSQEEPDDSEWEKVGGDDDEILAGLEEKEEKWDVMVPTIDETYADENRDLSQRLQQQKMDVDSGL